MKRFGDDVHDNPLFKRSFGSSPRESYGQSQVHESGFGGIGGGTRRASKDEGGSSVSKFDFEQAINLVNKIKKRLENDHDYKSFINILSVYRKENKDIKEVYHEVAIILNEHPDLLDECTMFLLNSSTNLDNNKTLMRLHKEQKKTRAEKENMGKRIHNEEYKEPDNENKDALKYTHGKEFTFCEKVKERVRSPADYQTFLKCLYIYSKEIITREQLQRLVCVSRI
uniref:Putative ovule protein n=1 Tax=Solanum chacoense TaxID=4108 RepID=A0A0V0I7T0_SOLCH